MGSRMFIKSTSIFFMTQNDKELKLCRLGNSGIFIRLVCRLVVAGILIKVYPVKSSPAGA
jgi:hypothetical protein